MSNEIWKKIKKEERKSFSARLSVVPAQVLKGGGWDFSEREDGETFEILLNSGLDGLPDRYLLNVGRGMYARHTEKDSNGNVRVTSHIDCLQRQSIDNCEVMSTIFCPSNRKFIVLKRG